MNIPDTEIGRIRSAMRALRAELERQMEVEYAAQSASLQRDLEDTVYTLHTTGGLSLNKIAKQHYGTSNWQTVKDLYLKAQERRQTAVNNPETQAEEVKIEAIPSHPDGFPNAHRVTLSSGEVAEVYVYGDSLRLISTEGGTQVRDALLDESGDLYETIKKEVLSDGD